MATIGHNRRAADGRAPRPRPFAPTPGGLGPPDVDGFLRSLGHALEETIRSRRPMTLVSLAVDAGGQDAETALDRVAALVRRTVRQTDGVWRDGPASLVVLLADADGPSAEPALARISLRLRQAPGPAVHMGRAAATRGIDGPTLLQLAREDRRPVHRGR